MGRLETISRSQCEGRQEGGDSLTLTDLYTDRQSSLVPALGETHLVEDVEGSVRVDDSSQAGDCVYRSHLDRRSQALLNTEIQISWTRSRPLTIV